MTDKLATPKPSEQPEPGKPVPDAPNDKKQPGDLASSPGGLPDGGAR